MRAIRIILAPILAILYWPLGYLYLGAMRRFISAVLLVSSVPVLLGLWIGLLPPLGSFSLILVYGLPIGLALLVVIDTFLLARKETGRHRLLSYPHVIWFTPIALAFSIAMNVQLIPFARTLADLRVVRSDSMEPTLKKGDVIVTTSRLDSNVKPGDLFVVSWNNETDYVKRVIAVPMQSIEIRSEKITSDGNQLYIQVPVVDGVEYETELIGTRSTAGTLPMLELEEVATGGVRYSILESGANFDALRSGLSMGAEEYFVLSDNRDNGVDSRYRGPLRRNQLTEKYTYTLLSFDLSLVPADCVSLACMALNAPIRWDRVGIKH